VPRLPGRESTRQTIEIENAVVANFQMPWENQVFNKPCCIKGCEHRCDGRPGASGSFKPFEPCATGSAGVIYDKRIEEANDDRHPYVGMACPHHVDEILALGQV